MVIVDIQAQVVCMPTDAYYALEEWIIRQLLGKLSLRMVRRRRRRILIVSFFFFFLSLFFFLAKSTFTFRIITITNSQVPHAVIITHTCARMNRV